MALAPGTRLGPYEIVAALGAGGMGEVYSARDPRIGRDVAIKVLPAAFTGDAERLRRFQQEARAAGALNHPNLVALYDVGSSDTGPYLVTELLDGEPLRDRLRRGPVAERDALGWIRQIAHGLSAAHGRGIVHRDLKPENVFLLRDGRVKILDFGLAKVEPPAFEPAADTATAAVALTQAGIALGTVGYMAPEQIRGLPAGPPADVFALGTVIYEILTGGHPFRRQTSVETLNAILNETPAVPASVSAGLARIITRCLEKDPQQRFQSAADVAFALDAASDDPAPARARRGGAIKLSVAIAAILMTAVSTLWFVASRRDAGTAPRAPAPSTTAVRMTPFLSSDAIAKQPAWSPAGNLIAYVSDAAGNDDVWISDTTGGSPVNLTSASRGADGWPAWSPDGKRLAFYSERDGGGIFTMTSLGSSVRRVVPLKPGILYAFSLSWARDDSLVYTGFDGSGFKRVYRVPAAGGDAVCVSCGVHAEGRAGELSPSGEYLAFLSGPIGPRADLFVAHLPTGRIRQITNRADAPHWSPDGRHLLFISDREGPSDLWQLAIAADDGAPAGDPRRLTSALDVTAFALAPDGKQILAVKEQSTSHLVTLPLGRPLSSLAGAVHLTSGPVSDRRGRWAGDGRSIFFESVRRGSLDIWRLAVPGDRPERLTTADGSELRPRPSPDGTWVAFDIVDRRGEFTHVMRADGSQIHPLNEAWLKTHSQVCCADWSPDGGRLAVATATGGATRSSGIAIAAFDRAAGTASAVRHLTDLPGGTPQYARWSPDGRFLVYEAVTDGSWDLWIVDPDAPRPQRLTTFGGNDRQAVWQKEPLALYFLRDDREVWRIPMTASGSPGGPEQRWFAAPGRLKLYGDSLSISPSADRLLTTIVTPSSAVWLVELK